jgi:hypothetical protein
MGFTLPWAGATPLHLSEEEDAGFALLELFSCHPERSEGSRAQARFCLRKAPDTGVSVEILRHSGSE